MEQQKMNGKERNAMVYLVALDDELTKATPILKNRLRSASQNAWRDWRLAQTLVQRLACLLVDTMPDKDANWLARLVKESQLRIDIPGPLNRGDYMLVDSRDLMEISRMAAARECSICLKGRKDAKECRLHKTLEWIAPMPDSIPSLPDELYTCEYAQVDWNAKED